MPERNPPISLTDKQEALVRRPLDSKTFLHGPAGSGKSTVGVHRLRYLLTTGVPGGSILVLTPQRTLQEPYLAMARSPEAGPGTEVEALTIGGLARRLCDLFWPLVADKAGFAQTDRPPFFLTLESSQYYMSHLVQPLLDQGYFQTVTMDRNRLYAQILDSLNKSAAVGFPHTEIGARLEAAWVGDPAQRRIYREAQDCATRFRQFCLQHNLLDFSLQLELLWSYLWLDPTVVDFLRSSYRHLIYDNVEEDVPRAHDMVRDWLKRLESALLIYDDQGGYRRFLGADVETAWELHQSCSDSASLQESFVMSEALDKFAISLLGAIQKPSAAKPGRRQSAPSDRGEVVIHPIFSRFFPEMLDRLASEIHGLIFEHRIPASEIVIVGPYLSDALRFAVISRLEALHIPMRTHRPSRSLRDEAATQALRTLCALAHPHWHTVPARFDVARTFMSVLGMDLVRAHLLEEIVYRKDGSLTAFEDIAPDMQDRITHAHGARFSRLRAWLQGYLQIPPQPLDYFFTRLFGELLSQPGFGFHNRFDAARIVSNLIESVRKFRLAMEPSFVDRDHPDFDIGKEYLDLLAEGVLAPQYLEAWQLPPAEAVLLAPAHAFLMMNRPAAVQFWLDPGSSGWFERLDQPLTHTRVLSRGWPPNQKWTFAEEEQANLDGMLRVAVGLIRRCRGSIYPCISELGESGFEQRGRLLLAIRQVLHDTNIVLAS